MSGRKFNLFILLIVLLSIGLGEGAPRFRYRKRKGGRTLSAVVGSAIGAGLSDIIRSHSKAKTTPAPQTALFLPSVNAYPNQQYNQQPLGQFNQAGNFNQINTNAPAAAPTNNFPAAPGTPVQYPLQPNGDQPVGPFAVITNPQPTPKKNSKSSASTFNLNAGCFGLMAMASYLMVTGNRFNL